MRPELKRFADAMESTLAAHDDERGNGWRGESIKWLLGRLKAELNELEKAFDNCDPKGVRDECLDVANFAMFIHSKLAKEGS